MADTHTCGSKLNGDLVVGAWVRMPATLDRSCHSHVRCEAPHVMKHGLGWATRATVDKSTELGRQLAHSHSPLMYAPVHVEQCRLDAIPSFARN